MDALDVDIVWMLAKAATVETKSAASLSNIAVAVAAASAAVATAVAVAQTQPANRAAYLVAEVLEHFIQAPAPPARQSDEVPAKVSNWPQQVG